MSWHLAPALDQLRAEVNALWPNRSKASDGTIGDASHSARTSDHNPNGRRSVNAIDLTASGIDTGKLINAAKAHPSVRYIIHKGRIMNRDIGNFQSRHYSGSNPHNTHVHISIYQSRTAEQRTKSWGLANAKGGGTSGGSTYTTVTGSTPLVKLYHKGEPVKRIQAAVGVKADGYYGPDTATAVGAFQKKYGLAADKIVGPDTWAKINGGKKPAGKPSGRAPGPGYDFPLPSGAYFGPKSGPNNSYSGFHNRTVKGKTDREWIKEWAKQLVRRGWSVGKGKTYLSRSGNDGLWGSEYAALCKAFQRSQGLPQDSLCGKRTWDEAFKSPVT